VRGAQRRRNRTAQSLEPALPVITEDVVRARWQAGQFGRIEVYPIPESVVPGTPSSIVSAAPDLPTPPVHNGQRPVQAGASGYRFIVDGQTVDVRGAGVIGRRPDADAGKQAIAVADPGRSLSRSHLGFETDSRGRLLVVDLLSANGSEIIDAGGGRTECVPGRRYVVTDGDVLLLGDFDVVVGRG